jgi:hypothetical protein
MIFCLSCAEYECVVTLPGAQGPSYRCRHCGPVVSCEFRPTQDVPECYIRSLDELPERLAALLDDDDIPPLDVPPFVIEPSEFRCSEHGCLTCGGPVTFLYWTDEREIDAGAQCHRCDAVELVTFDPVEPKFRAVAAGLSLARSLKD